MDSLKKNALVPILSCFSLGCLGVLAFAPFHFYPLIFISLAGLLLFFGQSSLKQAFYYGYSYGFGFFGLGIYWVYISLSDFGHAPVFLSLLLTLIFIGLLALFPACAAALLNYTFKKNSLFKYGLAFPAIWTLFEWARSWLFTGFPWLLVGNSQTLFPFKSLAAIGSVYMLSFIVAHISGVLLYLKYCSPFNRFKGLIYLLFLIGICASLSFIHWTQPQKKPITVSLIQGNLTPSLKWQPEQAENHYQHYLDLSNRHWDNQLLIWPEAAIPSLIFNESAIFHELEQITEKHKTGFIIGALYADHDAFSPHYYNAAIGLGKAKGLYFKHHLVPFGEYFPLANLTKPILTWLNIPMSDLSAGKLNQDFIHYEDRSISVFICYESIFPDYVRTHALNSDFLLILSDDAWFGQSWAQAQHLQMAQMRAIETGRYVLSTTNNGMTAIIDPEGKMIESIPAYQSGILSSKIESYSGNTPWVKFGPNIYLLICIFSLIIGKILEKRLIHFD